MFRNPNPVSQPAERRDDRRRMILARAVVEIPGMMQLKVHAVDLSRDGVGLQSRVPLTQGQELKIALPIDAEGVTHMAELSGVVRYCRQQSDRHFRIGVQFVNLDETAAALLQALFAE